MSTYIFPGLFRRNRDVYKIAGRILKGSNAYAHQLRLQWQKGTKSKSDPIFIHAFLCKAFDYSYISMVIICSLQKRFGSNFSIFVYCNTIFASPTFQQETQKKNF